MRPMLIEMAGIDGKHVLESPRADGGSSAMTARLAAAPGKTMTGEDRPHRGRRNSDAEALQFADDPPVTPTRVLARQSNNQRLDATIEPWPPRPPVRIGPTP